MQNLIVCVAVNKKKKKRFEKRCISLTDATNNICHVLNLFFTPFNYPYFLPDKICPRTNKVCHVKFYFSFELNISFRLLTVGEIIASY